MFFATLTSINSPLLSAFALGNVSDGMHNLPEFSRYSYEMLLQFATSNMVFLKVQKCGRKSMKVEVCFIRQ